VVCARVGFYPRASTARRDEDGRRPAQAFWASGVAMDSDGARRGRGGGGIELMKSFTPVQNISENTIILRCNQIEHIAFDVSELLIEAVAHRLLRVIRLTYNTQTSIKPFR
jgi:hypothetical protein